MSRTIYIYLHFPVDSKKKGSSQSTVFEDILVIVLRNYKEINIINNYINKYIYIHTYTLFSC